MDLESVSKKKWTSVLHSYITRRPYIIISYHQVSFNIFTSHLLVARRATYVVDGRFFGHFFWKVEWTVRTHVNSRVAHMWLPYTVINVQGGGGNEHRKTQKIWKFLKICIKVTGSIVSHIGSHEWQPS